VTGFLLRSLTSFLRRLLARVLRTCADWIWPALEDRDISLGPAGEEFEINGPYASETEIDTSGIPAHWLERVRRDAPELLRRPVRGGAPIQYAPRPTAPASATIRGGRPRSSPLTPPPARDPAVRPFSPRHSPARLRADIGPGQRPFLPYLQPPSVQAPVPVRPTRLARRTPAESAPLPGNAPKPKSEQAPPSPQSRNAPVQPWSAPLAHTPQSRPDDEVAVPRQPSRTAHIPPPTRPTRAPTAPPHSQRQRAPLSDRKADAVQPEAAEDLYVPIDLDAADEPREQTSPGSGQAQDFVATEDLWPELPEEPVAAPPEWTNSFQKWERGRRLDSEQRGDRRWSA
jgi:hypothetical protein